MRLLFHFIFQIFALSFFAIGSFGANFVVSNLVGSGPGTLPDAITNATASSGRDTITFTVAGEILLSGNLVITDTLFIDGSSAPGYSGVPVISLSGGGVVFSGSTASNSKIKAIHIYAPGTIPVYGTNCDNLSILGCYINTDFASGSQDNFTSNYGTFGIQLQGCNNPTIGASGNDNINVIHSDYGVSINNCTGGLIKNNHFGINKSGSSPGGPIPYPYAYEVGVYLWSSANSITVDSNKIGNYSTGIYTVSSSNNIIKNNNMNIVNLGSGIVIYEGNNNLIFRNNIRSGYLPYAVYTGVAITLYEGSSGSISNKISQNIFQCNTQAIVLNASNGNQLAPAFDTSVYALSPSVAISGKAQPFDSVEIYRTPSCTQIEGEIWLASVKADNGGNWTYNYTGGVGGYLVATATSNPNDNTSAFSTAAQIVDCSLNTIYAGANDTLCWQGAGVGINVLPDASSNVNIAWTSKGNGVFDNLNYINSYYYPPVTDTLIFRDTLIVTSIGTGVCPTISDTTIIVFNPAPVADAGLDQNVCSTSPNVVLNGKIFRPSSSFIWSSSGAGTFSPDANTLNASYIPAPADTLGSVDLTLTPAAGSCAAISDNITITFDHNNVAYAGADQADICANSAVSMWQATISGGGAGHWLTSGTGKFMRGYPPMYSDSIFASNVYYYPSPLDTTKSTMLTLVADNGACPSTLSSMNVTFTPASVAVAGNDTVICGGSDLQLDGKIYNSTSCKWTTSGDGTFEPNEFTLNAKYVPGPNDISNGAGGGGGKRMAAAGKIAAPSEVVVIGPGAITISLQLLNGIAACSLNTSSFKLQIKSAPQPGVTSIGDPTDKYIICQGDSLYLQGSIAANSDTSLVHTWQGTGTGEFYPSVNSMNAYYIPSDADKKKVAVILSFVVTLPGCESYEARSSVLGLVLPLPDVGIGTIQHICPDDYITLTAVSPAYGEFGQWSLVNKTFDDKEVVSSGILADSSSNETVVSSITESINFYRWTLTDTTTGCVNSTDFTVFKCFEPELNVFNAVTPNNDGMHEFFEIENIEAYEDNNVSIYNRWGDLVFEMDNYHNAIPEKRFEGKSNVKSVAELPIGTYFYHIKKNSKIEKGTLILRR